MPNQYPFDSQQPQPDATTLDDNLYPAPTRPYGNQPQYNPPAGPGRYNPIGDQTTRYSPAPPPLPAQPSQPQRAVLVAPPIRTSGDGLALWSFILGLVSLGISVVPVCGIVALLPAAMSIIFGMAGLKSRRRSLAALGLLLSLAAITLAVTLVA